MAHTTYLLNGSTIGNSDWSGDIILRFPKDKVAQSEHREELEPLLQKDGSYSVPIPGGLLKSIAAQMIRDAKIEALEQAEDDDIINGKS